MVTVDHQIQTRIALVVSGEVFHGCSSAAMAHIVGLSLVGTQLSLVVLWGDVSWWTGNTGSGTSNLFAVVVVEFVPWGSHCRPCLRDLIWMVASTSRSRLLEAKVVVVEQ